MFKRIIAVTLIIGLAFLLFGNRASQDTAAAKDIETLLQNGETRIDLAALTDFDWTQAAVFEPYTTNKVIEDTMGVRFKGDNGHIDVRDDRYLLVFATERSATKTVVLSMEYGRYQITDERFLSVLR